jgi:hypothetical protein
LISAAYSSTVAVWYVDAGEPGVRTGSSEHETRKSAAASAAMWRRRCMVVISRMITDSVPGGQRALVMSG